MVCIDSMFESKLGNFVNSLAKIELNFLDEDTDEISTKAIHHP